MAISIHVETNGNDLVIHMKQKNLSNSVLSESLTIADQMQEGKAKYFKIWYVIEGTSYSSVRV